MADTHKYASEGYPPKEICCHVRNAKKMCNVYGKTKSFKIGDENIDLCAVCINIVQAYKSKYHVGFRACESSSHALLCSHNYYQHKNTVVFKTCRVKNDKWRCYTCIQSIKKQMDEKEILEKKLQVLQKERELNALKREVELLKWR